jgi:8-oxo-dGTP pyrophosphatase MutT (NUDIX family)
VTVPIRDASTVLPLRDGPDGLEVFMVKRSSRLGFLGGAHVFPGGAVDAGDRDPALDDHLDCFAAAAAARTLGIEDADRARGHYVAAIRELFEEAGILLARRDGGWIEHGDDALGRGFALAREDIAHGKLPFAAFVADLAIKLAADALCYFAHWITPAVESRRFDTRFFLARMPERQHARHDRVESIEGEWIRPEAGLARYARHEIELVPPTICALDWLALHGGADVALEAAVALEIVEVLPKIIMDGRGVTILYPGDDDYAAGVPQPAEAGRMLNRLVLKDGLWVKP